MLLDSDDEGVTEGEGVLDSETDAVPVGSGVSDAVLEGGGVPLRDGDTDAVGGL